jgi:hypothetical protein
VTRTASATDSKTSASVQVHCTDRTRAKQAAIPPREHRLVAPSLILYDPYNRFIRNRSQRNHIAGCSSSNERVTRTLYLPIHGPPISVRPTHIPPLAIIRRESVDSTPILYHCTTLTAMITVVDFDTENSRKLRCSVWCRSSSKSIGFCRRCCFLCAERNRARSVGLGTGSALPTCRAECCLA